MDTIPTIIQNTPKQKKKFNKVLCFLSLYYFAIVVWWIVLLVTHQKEGLNNFMFALMYGFIPMFGGIFGIFEAK